MKKSSPPEEVKRRIVIELASFKTPAEVSAIIRQEYDLTIDRNIIQKYDASKEYCAAGKPLRDLFLATRQEFVDKISDIPIAKPAYRLRKLQAMSMAAEQRGSLKLAAELLEQAAKEVGGFYTNVKEVKGQVEHRHEMTPDEARATIERFLNDQKAKQEKQTQH